MKLKIANGIIIFLLIISFTQTSFAYFDNFGMGSRPRGMGHAFGAVSGDINGLAYNPGVLSSISFPSFSTTYSRLYMGLTDGSNIFDGTLVGGFPISTYGTIAAGWQTLGLLNFFSEDAILVGYGSPQFKFLWGTLGVGVTGKFLAIKQVANIYTYLNPNFTDLSTSAIGADIGLIYSIGEFLSLGFSVGNINQPKLSLIGDDAKLPIKYRLSFAYKPESSGNFMVVNDHVYSNKNYEIHIGMEQLFFDRQLALRAGASLASIGSGALKTTDISFGSGYNWKITDVGDLAIDYSFLYPISGLTGTYGTHKLSISLALTKPKVVAIERKATPVVLTEIKLKEPNIVLVDPTLTSKEELQNLKKQFEQNQRDVLLAHELAVIAYCEGDLPTAVTAYERVHDLEPKLRSVTRRAIGKIRYEPNNPKGIIEAYEDALADDSANSEIAMMLGFLYLKEGQFLASKEAYKQAFEGGSAKTFASLYNLGIAHIGIEKAEEAEANLKEAATFKDASWALHEGLGRVAFSQKRYDMALLSWQRASEASPKNPYIYTHIGTAYYYATRFDDALASFQKAINIYPSDEFISNAFELVEEATINFHISTSKEYQSKFLYWKAKEECEKALAIDPTDEDTKEFMTTLQGIIKGYIAEHTEKATIAMEDTKTQDALKEWKLVLDADPTNPKALEKIKGMSDIVFSKAKDEEKKETLESLEQAYKYYELFLQVDPESGAAKSGLAFVVAALFKKASSLEQTDKLIESATWWNKLIELEHEKNKDAIDSKIRVAGKREEKARNLLAQSKEAYDKKDIVKAGETIKQAFEFAPHLKEIADFYKKTVGEIDSEIKKHYSAAITERGLGNFKKAISELKLVLKLDPNHAESKELLRDVEEAYRMQLTKLINEAERLDDALEPNKALSKLNEVLRFEAGHKRAAELKDLIEGRLDSAVKNKTKVAELKKEGDKAFGKRKVKEAIDLWKQALDLDYYNNDIRSKIADAKKELR